MKQWKHTVGCNESGSQSKYQATKNNTLFLLVKTTSDATLDGMANIGLTQEQPEGRIGSEKDPGLFL